MIYEGNNMIILDDIVLGETGRVTEKTLPSSSTPENLLPEDNIDQTEEPLAANRVENKFR